VTAVPGQEIVNLILRIGGPLLLIGVGFFAGRINEARHRASLRRREAMPGPVLTNLERLPGGMTAVQSSFCIGNVVIASDYFKFFGAQLKTLVGGRLRTLETLIDRGRREALLRVREQAAAVGADVVLNVRLETAVVMRGRRNRPYPAAEVLAYGTAVKLA
jgi:uncharacterized protein YbjQ (UPF0145 family)